jgi:hypothetical protein
MSLMLTCREMVDLVSEELDTKLTLPMRMKMTLHLSMCGYCKNYRDQIHHVEEMIKTHFSDAKEIEVPALSDSARVRIEKELENLS